MLRSFAIFSFLILFTGVAEAGLSTQQLDRVKVAKDLLRGVDGKSLEMTIQDIENSPYPEGNLQIFEAIASTYKEMLKEYNLPDQSQKEWLHSMVLLNMAYIQLAGEKTKKIDSRLNMLIRDKLKERLSDKLLKDPRIVQRIE